MRRKNEAGDNFQRYVEDCKSVGIDIKKGAVLHADNDAVYRDRAFVQILASNHMQLRCSPPHTPALNGVAERYWRTIVDSARTLLIESRLPLAFWGAAIMHACMLRNSLPRATLSGKSPFELVHGRPLTTASSASLAALRL